MYVHTYMCTNIYTCSHTYINIYACTCTDMYMHIKAYIHTISRTHMLDMYTCRHIHKKKYFSYGNYLSYFLLSLLSVICDNTTQYLNVP